MPVSTVPVRGVKGMIPEHVLGLFRQVPPRRLIDVFIMSKREVDFIEPAVRFVDAILGLVLGDLAIRVGSKEPNCGLDKVHLSFGHDEYVYQATRRYLPEEAQYMLRYHSFYAAHRHGAYRHLMNEHDERMFDWGRKFNPYDLYSNGRERPRTQDILPYYKELVSEFFPDKIDW